MCEQSQQQTLHAAAASGSSATAATKVAALRGSSKAHMLYRLVEETTLVYIDHLRKSKLEVS
jgi:hypothetical protein